MMSLSQRIETNVRVHLRNKIVIHACIRIKSSARSLSSEEWVEDAVRSGVE